MVDVVYSDVAGNASPILALTNGIGLRMSPLWFGGTAHGVKSQLTGYRDEILRPVAVLLVQQRLLIYPATCGQSLSRFSGKQ